MNENINLVEILKNCTEGIKLYSMVHGEVEFVKCQKIPYREIVVRLIDESLEYYTSQGLLDGYYYEGECVLFPSKYQRDWSKFKLKKTKFDPKTLQPFDKVLVRDKGKDNWKCNLFSFIKFESEFKYWCIGCYGYRYCIPHNDDTKHLVGTTKEAPEYYRYWED